MGTIPAEEGVPSGVLVGLVDLESNPFTQPILSDLRAVHELGGVGYLLDESGRVLYSSQEELYGTFFPSFDHRHEEVFSKQTRSRVLTCQRNL